MSPKKSSDAKESKSQKIQSGKTPAQNIKLEDNDLALQPCLPSPSLLSLPNGFSHQDFSDLLMISDFFLGYSTFLMPNEKFSVDTDLMLKALLNVRFKGFEFIGKILVSFLEILIHSESLTELNTKIDEIPVNKYTALELVRLTAGGLSRLNCSDESDSGVDATSSSSAGETLNETCLEALEDADIYFLTPKVIIDVLVFLLSKVLQTTNFDDFLKDKEEEMSEAWKEKIEAQIQLKKYRLEMKAENKGKTTGKPEKSEQTDEKMNKSKSLTILHFYGKTATSSDKKENEKLTDDEIIALENVPDPESMIYKVKSRRAMATQEKAKLAEQEKLEREKKKKEMRLKSLIDRVAAATEKINTLQEFFKKVYRHEPIGIDRNYNRYWFFPKSSPGRLYVEKQHNFPNKENENFCDMGTLSTTSKEISSEIWYFYDKVEQLKELKKSLLTKGIRESRLLDNLSKIENEIIENLNSNTLEHSGELLDETERAENSFLNFLRSEFLETERKIRFGGMGGTIEFDVWAKKIETAYTLENFGDCLIELRKSVRPSLLKGSFASKKVPLKRDETNLEDGHIFTAEELKSLKQSQVWTMAVRKCKTWSRLTVLYYIFHNSIMWEKSAEQAPCKICRRKRDDENMLLCDQCNDPYHIYCLRPALKVIPESDWFCVKCRPPAKKARRVQIEESDDDFSDKEENQGESVCLACEKGESADAGDLVHCSSCSGAFHMDCHIPPLRHTPRSGWRCCVCVKGISFRRSLRKRRRY